MNKRVTYFIFLFFIFGFYNAHAEEGQSNPNYQELFDKLPVFTSLDGDEIDLDALSDNRMLVLRFWSNTCPHSASFDEKAKQLAEAYQDEVAVVDVLSNWKPDLLLAKQSRRQSGVNHPAIADEKSLMAKLFKAKTQAEFLIFDQDKTLVYHGYYYIEKSESEDVKPASICHIIDKVLAGEAVQYKRTKAAGCYIQANPTVTKEDLPLITLALEVSVQ